MGKDTQEVLWFCCKCTQFWSCSLYYTCISCYHRRCPCCTYKRVGKPGKASTQRAQQSFQPALPMPQPKSLHLFTGRQDLFDEQPPPGPGTTSSYVDAGRGFMGKLPSFQTSVELQKVRDSESYAVVFQMRETMPGGLSGMAIPASDSAKFGCSCDDEILQLIIKAVPETFTPSKGDSTTKLEPKSVPTGQRHQSQLRDGASRIDSSTYLLRSTLLSDNEAIYESPQAGTREPIPLTEIVLVKKDTPLRYGYIPTKTSTEGSRDTPGRHTRLGGIVDLPGFQPFGNAAPANQSEVGNVENGSDGCKITTLSSISALPPLVDIHDVTAQDLSDLLIQKAYRALQFNTYGAFRRRGGPQPSEVPQNLSNNDRARTTHPKRRLRGDHHGNSSEGVDDDRESSRTKTSRVKLRKLGGLLREFACPFCKRNLDYGYEARCIGWSNSNIDTVLRRHLQIHVDIETEHLSKAKYDQVNAMKKDYNYADPKEAEKLWVAAYMVIFEIEERNRHTVPDPYLRREDFPLDSNRATFFSNIIRFIAQNPASSLQIRAYVREIENLNREIDRRRQRIREEHRAREVRFNEENLAQLEADEQGLDNELDSRQRHLDVRFESILHPTRQLEHDANHPMPREGIGTRNEHPRSQSHIPDLVDQDRILTWDGPSGYASGNPSSAQDNLLMLSAVESAPRSDQGTVARWSLDDVFLPVQPPAMNAHDIEREAFLDIAARQAFPLTAARESQAEPDPSDSVPIHTDETPELAPSRDGNPCSCGRTCPKGQFSCEPCAEHAAMYLISSSFA